MSEPRVVERTPTVAEYRALRSAVGWTDVAPEVAASALEHSLYAVVLMEDDHAVGCGRIVGDGGVSFYVEDVAVLPTLQGRGFGTKIMDLLMAWLDANVPRGRA
ncbi:MAG: GNAT family N-acetyltransferase, partial [Actinomycetota bacterium]|nr:GNAT family N-acetyltransferase [Actinomycetota bacterium]